MRNITAEDLIIFEDKETGECYIPSAAEIDYAEVMRERKRQEQEGKYLLAYKLVETDNTTYDLTFENRQNKIIVYSYSNETYETELYDVFVKTNTPALTREENFYENIKRYIKETFDIDIDEIEMD